MSNTAKTNAAEAREREREAEARWGQSDAHKESARRTQSYTEQDWVTIKAEADTIVRALAEAQRAGTSPESHAVMDLAEQYRLHISARFYPCSHDMHAMLADGYVSDDRFRAFYDAYETGLADFLADAIMANGVRALGEAPGATSSLDAARGAQGLRAPPLLDHRNDANHDAQVEAAAHKKAKTRSR